MMTLFFIKLILIIFYCFIEILNLCESDNLLGLAEAYYFARNVVTAKDIEKIRIVVSVKIYMNVEFGQRLTTSALFGVKMPHE